MNAFLFYSHVFLFWMRIKPVSIVKIHLLDMSKLKQSWYLDTLGSASQNGIMMWELQEIKLQFYRRNIW